VDFLLLIGLSLFCIAFAAGVCESSRMVSYGVFGALLCIVFAAIVAILAVYGLVYISLHVGLWILPLMAAFMWADGCIRVGCTLLLVGL
jgi:hypothetical protein